ncbi:enoyl-CoA hydratase/isomerase family protein [Jatrophihabitans fulvus]
MTPVTEVVRREIDGAVATLTLERPDALNALTIELLEQLGDALESLPDDVAVVVLTGAGRAFSAGVDLKALGERRIENGMVGDVLDLPARRVIELITGGDRVVVAKVNGACFTGALELALACDIVIAADEAKFGDTHAKFGLRPTWGMSQRLPFLLGAARARLLSYTAATFTGREAAQWGLVARSVPRDELDATVAGLVEGIVANSHGSLRAYKDLYRAAERLNLTDGLAYEAATGYVIDDTESRVAGFRK